jgi:hypothetical protein
MKPRDRFPKLVAFAFSVALGAGAFAGFAAWAFSQLGSIEQQIVASGMTGAPHINAIQTGENHVDP